MLHEGSKRNRNRLFKCMLVLCLALVLEISQAFAADVTISANGSSSRSVGYGSSSFTVKLSGAYTGASCTGSKDWITVSKNGDTFTISVKANTTESERNDTLTFLETRAGTTTHWQLKVTQSGKPHSHSWSGWTVTSTPTCTSTGKKVRSCSCGATDSATIEKDPSNHAWGSWTVKSNATCIAEGRQERTCSRCGTTQSSSIGKNANNHTGRKTTTVNATCTANGYKVDVCTGCGKELSSKTVINATGHSYGNWITDTNAGCETAGTKHRICSKCNNRENGTIPKLGHNGNGQFHTVDATCTKDGYRIAVCSRCGKEFGDKTVIKASHTWGDWVASKQPGCETAGAGYRVCKKCNTKDTSGTIPALGHLYEGQIKTVAATCTKDGYKVVVCSRCGKEQDGTRATIPAGHSWGKWITDKDAGCESMGSKHRVCSGCNARENGTINPLGHDGNGQIKTVAPTCLVNGYRVTVCSRCGKELGARSTISATGHSWGKWITDKDATCEEAGTKHRACNKCGQKQSETIPKLGHLGNGQMKTVDSTCTKEGYRVTICSRCGKELGSRSIIAAKGHSWGSWITDKDSTCEEAGTRHHTCNRCGLKQGDTTPKLGHLVDGQTKTKEPTCTETGYRVVICSRCGKEMGDKTVLPAKGHTWGAWVTDKSPSCEKEGAKHHNCTICSAREDVVSPKTGHSVTGARKTVAATCVSDGYTVVTCNACGAELGEKKVLPKTGVHTWGSWIITKEAECEVDGAKYRKCKYCTAKDEAVIPQKGHLVTGVRKTVKPEHGGEAYSVVVCNRCGKEMSNRLLFDVPAPEVTIEFHISDKHGEGVTEPLVVKVPYDGKPLGDIFPKIPNPKQYTITAWRDKNGKQYDEYTVLTSTTKVDLYPIWGNTGEYTIFFVGNGAASNEIKFEVVKYDKSFTLPKIKDLFDSGVGFEKWSTSPDGDGQVFKDGETRTNFAGKNPSITLYAIWNESCTATYYDYIYHNVIATETLKHIYKVKGLNDFPELQIDGLTFKGWRKNNSLSDVLSAGTSYYADGNNWSLTPVYSSDTGTFAVIFHDSNRTYKSTVVKSYSYETVKWSSNYRNAKIALPEVFSEYDTLHYFAGWSYNGKVYKVDETVDVTSAYHNHSVIVMEAVWDRYPEDLYLYYGFDNKIEVITVTEDNYKLPVPEQKGYFFVGWSTEKDNRAKVVGDTYNVPKYGAKLYAIWDKLFYSIEYYDGMTGEIIGKAQTVTVTDLIKADTAYIPGLKFAGWVEDRITPYDAEKAIKKYEKERDKVYNQGAYIVELPLNKITTKLYSLYVPVDSTDGQTIVYFHSGKGSGIIDPKYFYKDSVLTLPACNMTVRGSTFTGWKIAGTDKVYKAGDSYEVDVKKTKCQAVVFVAQWKSDHTITLDPNYPGAQKVDLSEKYASGDYIMTKDFVGYSDDYKGYTLVGWEASQKGFCRPYGMDTQIYVPNEDLTLTAIWSKNKYKVYYHSGFNEYIGFMSDESYEKTKLTFDKTKIYMLEDPKYEFIGWTLKNPNGFPCDVDASEIITPENNVERVLLEDLHVYSCYKEKELDVSDERVLVSYNWMGGTDGPKDEYFNPTKGKYHISDVIPKRSGYAFEGWKTYDILVHDGNYDKYIVDNVLALYASWIPLANNVMKDAYQRQYGKDKMPDYMFLTEYQTTEWRKINDYCYFAIKTFQWNDKTADHYKEMDSIVLVIEYKDGKWILTGQSSSTNWREQLEYDILTQNTDTWGRVIKGASDVLIEGLEEHPVFKYFVNCFDFGSACNEAKALLKKGEVPGEAADKVVSKVLDLLYDAFFQEFKDPTFVSELIMQVAPNVKTAVKDTLELNKDAFVDLLDTMESLCSIAADNPYECIDDLQLLLLQVDDYVKADLSKTFVSKVYNKLDDVRVDEDKLGKLEKNFDIASKGFKAASLVLGIVFDNIKYQKSINEAMDPFGKMNLALKTFYDQIDGLEFDSNIKDTFGSVIRKIYDAYCTLKK